MHELANDDLISGRAALARRDWEGAYTKLRAADHARPLAPDDLEALAEAARWSRRFGEVIEILECAEQTHLREGNRRRAAGVALMLAVEHYLRAGLSVASGSMSRAMRYLEGETECVEHALLERCLGRAAMHSGDITGARGHLERAIDIARRYGDPDVEALAVHDFGHLLLSTGQVSEGLKRIDEAAGLAMGGTLGLMAAGAIYCGTILACRNRGDYQRAGEWTEVATRWCTREAVSGFPGVCRTHRAEILRLRGDLVQAEREAEAAVADLREASPRAAGSAWQELGDTRLRRGNLSAAAEAYRQAIALGVDPQPGLALLRLSEGNPESARRALEPALTSAALEHVENRPHLLPAWVSIVLAAGDTETARAACEELDSLADLLGTPAVRASAACARGELALATGRAGEAVEQLGRAWRWWCDTNLVYEAARARALLADAYRLLGDVAAAILELEVARDAYMRVGAVGEAARLAARLATEQAADESAPAAPARQTFMFTDIVGSTPLVEAIGDEAWEALHRWHDRTLRACFAEHDGEEIDHVGDGFFVAFTRASAAVECAIAIQRTLVQHRREHGFAPQVRIGLHSTLTLQRGRERTGKGVHEAARIGAAAGGGEILASVATLREPGVSTATSASRWLTLKGLSEPVEVVAIEWSSS